MQDEEGLLALITSLEVLLHQPAVRRDRARLDALLHPAFFEFGRSGRVWSREEVLDEFTADGPPADLLIHAETFALQALSSQLALLTYRSAHRADGGELSRWTRRSSLWQCHAGAWVMRFHQGTPLSDP